MGHVRLCQLWLHHRGHHRAVQCLLRRRGGRQCVLGHAGVDRGAFALLCAGGAKRAAGRCLRRPARSQEATACGDDGGLRGVHRPALFCAARHPWPGHPVRGPVQLLLWQRRKPDRRLPAVALHHPRPGPGIGLGLEPWLYRWPGHAGRMPALCQLGHRTRPRRQPVRARHHADHGDHLCPGEPADLPAAARPRRATDRCARAGWRTGLGQGMATPGPAAPVQGPAPLPAVHPVLPGRHPGSDHADRHLRQPGHGLHHAADPDPGAGGQPDGGGRRLPVRPCAGPHRPRARHCPDAAGLDPDHPAGARRARSAAVLACRQRGRPVPGRRPVRGTGHGGAAGPALARGRVLRSLGPGGQAGLDRRAADLWHGKLADGRRSPAGAAGHRQLLRGRAGPAVRGQHHAGPAGCLAR
ncbi:hypothetical protein D3C72_1111810 [compost metagenome]